MRRLTQLAWRRNVTAFALLALLLCFGSYLWADLSARLKFAREHARFEAAGLSVPAMEVVLTPSWSGQLVEPEPDAIPTGSALDLYLQAQAASHPTILAPNNTGIELAVRPRLYDAQYVRLAAASHAANGKVFELVREARSAPEADPPVTIQLSEFTQLRQLVNTISDEVLHQHLQGNDAEAIELVIDLHRVSRQQQRALLGWILGQGVEAQARAYTAMIMPRLNRSTRAGARPATDEQLDKLLRLLLDEEHDRQHRRDALLKTNGFVDRIVELGLTHPRLGASGWIFEGPRNTVHRAEWRQAATLLLTQTPDQYMPQLAAANPSAARLASSYILFPAFSRRALAVSIAWQRYEIAKGKPAQTIQQLVDAGYLPYVPKSAFEPVKPLRIVIIGKTGDGRDRYVVVDSERLDPESPANTGQTQQLLTAGAVLTVKGSDGQTYIIDPDIIDDGYTSSRDHHLYLDLRTWDPTQGKAK